MWDSIVPMTVQDLMTAYMDIADFLCVFPGERKLPCGNAEGFCALRVEDTRQNMGIGFAPDVMVC